jgi:hypothetical protein
MASTISAGTTTTTALVYSADTSGVLQLQTNGGTTALTLDTSQNATFAGKVASASSLQLATNGTTTAVTIDTNQNVGIGVIPSAWNSIYKVQQIGAQLVTYNYGGYNGWGANFYIDSAGTNRYIQTDYATIYQQNRTNGVHAWYIAPSGTAGNVVTFTQAMTLDNSGNLLVGNTATNLGVFTVYNNATNFASVQALAYLKGTQASDSGVTGLIIAKYANDSTPSQILARFTINNGANGQGQINANGAGAVAFGSYSDSRLKENIVTLPSQLSNILALHPVEFDYIEAEGGGHQVGFIAQEFQQVYPDAVSKREPDGMLTVTGWSKTEARLVKAIQELSAQVTTLQTQVTALKG